MMTSLHGLKYLMEPGRPFYEKFFWFVTLCFAWTVAGSMIYLVDERIRKLQNPHFHT